MARAADDFFQRQIDVWVDGGGAQVDPLGGLDDDYDDALVGSWGDDAMNFLYQFLKLLYSGIDSVLCENDDDDASFSTLRWT